MLDPATMAAILSFGGPGIVIIVLLGVIRTLWQKLDASQEARILEGKEVARVAAASAAALDVANRNSILILNELQLRGRLEPAMGILTATRIAG